MTTTSPVAQPAGEPRTSADASDPPDPPTDAEVIAASLADPGRFAEIFDRHAAPVHRYLARRIGAVADDVLADTFLVAFRRRREYQPLRVDVRPWLLGIATNLLHRYARDERRRYRALTRLESRNTLSITDEADDRIDAQSIRSDLAGALAALKPPDRDVLLLVAWEQLTYAEIAEVLDIPVGTVRSRLNRARRITRDALNLPEEDLL